MTDEVTITIRLNDLFEKENERRNLKKLFRNQDDSELGNDSELAEHIKRIIKVSMSEYKQMFLGRGLPTRADEIQQYRLYYLIKYYFNGTIPTEAMVSSMFQLTPSKSRNLLRNVLTKFRYDLNDEIDNTLKNILNESKYLVEENEFRFIVKSDNNRDELNRIISLTDDNEHLKRNGTSRIYSVAPSSCKAICEHFEIDYNAFLASKRERA